MDKAKATVSDILHKAGHHDTTVHERVAPAVVNEHVTQTLNTERQKVVDKEIHQDHFHTTVQPIKDREVLPEEHQHRMAGVEHREHHHGNEAEIKARLEREAAQFKHTRTEGGIRETSTTVPVVAGEHVHHHVHETIQPVVQKETIQPSVVHTTIPVHEVHHNAAQHHSASALPAVSMADFKRQGGALSGRDERYDHFQGEPKGVASALGHGNNSTTGENISGTHHHNAGLQDGNLANQGDTRVGSELDGSRNVGLRSSGHNNTGVTGMSNTTTGPHNSSLVNKADPRVDSDLDGSRIGRSHQTTAGPHDSTLANKSDPRVDSDMDSSRLGRGVDGNQTTAGPHSSKIANKADPRVDSDLDGSRRVGDGTANQTTTGHHSSNIANTADPRVDSNLDGSRRVGDSSGTGYNNSSTSNTTNTTNSKPSLLDRLNPLVDTSQSKSYT